ncbi:MAG TPA: serine/threonine-protein kinase [Rhodocyclaceae bacterium]|nr:serine/threonine-protein kinase [Rhodocyclaceae bacterium]
MTDKANGLPLPPGLQDRYEVRREIGRGATGIVYLGTDVYNRRDVAIKVAHPHIFQESEENALTRKAWLNEVHLAGSLKHPYIVEVFDAGVGPDTAWLVMEYLPHGTLEPFVRPDNLRPLHEVLEIVYKCASALDYACRNGIIHRDVKPANLQYVGPGEAKVCDFGAAYWSRNDATQILDIGSLAYMSPELFNQSITPQADIYALGVVLFQLLTGRLPFQADSQAALIYAIMKGERPALLSLRAELPTELEALVNRMLAPSLENRHPNWNEVLKDLTVLLQRLRVDAASTVATPKIRRAAHAEIYDELRQLPLLEEFNDAQLWELLRSSRWYQVPEGTVLITEGAPASSCYLLLTGEAKVTQQGKLMNWLSPGTIFGELAFATRDPAPRAATVVAAGNVTVGKWPYDSLRKASPEVQNKMLQIFFRLAAERLRQADEQYLLLYRQYMKAKQGGE